MTLTKDFQKSTLNFSKNTNDTNETSETNNKSSPTFPLVSTLSGKSRAISPVSILNPEFA